MLWVAAALASISVVFDGAEGLKDAARVTTAGLIVLVALASTALWIALMRGLPRALPGSARRAARVAAAVVRSLGIGAWGVTAYVFVSSIGTTRVAIDSLWFLLVPFVMLVGACPQYAMLIALDSAVASGERVGLARGCGQFVGLNFILLLCAAAFPPLFLLVALMWWVVFIVLSVRIVVHLSRQLRGAGQSAAGDRGQE